MGKIVTSYGINKMTGRVGDGVFSIEEGGTGLRQYNGVSRQPFTPAQLEREAAFAKANQTWTTIGMPAATAWRKWGATQRVKTVAGKTRKRQGKDCFTGCFAKMLQIDPNAAIPTPPVGSFVPDDLSFGLNITSTAVELDASKANRAGVTTEFLVQALPSAVALVNPKGYLTARFKAFATGSMTVTLPLSPGFYEIAAQSVEVSTGRVAGFMPVARVAMGLSVVQGGLDDAEDSGLAKAA